jgi:Eco57I restriction-modification methylase/restriction-modification enzyme MmeI-like protein
MSIARHHAEWLSLVETSGPFLSMPVLLRVFPQGLDAHDPEHARDLRLAFEEWEDNQGGLRPDPAIHRAWIRFILGQTLELPEEVIAEGQALPPGLEARVAEHGETLRPDLAVIAPQGVAETPPQPPDSGGSGGLPERATVLKDSMHLGRNPDSGGSGRVRVREDRDTRTGPGSGGNGRVRLLVQAYPPDQRLERPVEGRVWKASPATRMMELLHATGVPLGLVTNGEHWMLVHAPRGETTGFASWYASLWLEEPVTLRAFRSLLSAHRFFGVAAGDTLEALLKESSQDQQEVTYQLGYQVRRAVEVLVQAIDRIDQDRGRTLLLGVDEKRLYEAALTVMMRLVFLLSAEERKLLELAEDPVYLQHYAVSTLLTQLREAADQHGEEVLERRHDAWSRLLATFRVVYGGVRHERLSLPPYGGTLFNPDRFPFLEGRDAATSWLKAPAQPLPVNNRTVLHLLEALQVLQVKVPGAGPAEARRLSFRALDIEQIGHVYEGLLDHTAVRAPSPVLGLAGTRDREPEIPLERLEELRERGEDALVQFLKEQTGRSESALKRALTGEAPGAGRRSRKTGAAAPSLFAGESAGQNAHPKLLAACGNDPALFERVLPLAGLLREDTAGHPVVIGAGSVYVTQGADRRTTGTHYTPRSLTESIVQHTLDPLVYTGPAEGKPKEEWRLRSPKEILDLKVCDPAMGSGAFLVQACRYLSERLAEAWDTVCDSHHGDHPLSRVPETRRNTRRVGDVETGGHGDVAPPDAQRSMLNAQRPTPERRVFLTPAGELTATASPETRPLAGDADERLAQARRIIADHCLYGVDKNPMAVEMAKLSLWLITLARGKPFTFLDHRLKHGDSLVGCTWREASHGKLRPLPDHIPDEAYRTRPGDPEVVRSLRERNEQERQGQLTYETAVLPAENPDDYRRLAEYADTPEGQQQKEQYYRRLRDDARFRKRRLAADLWCAAWFWPLDREHGPRAPTTGLYRAVLERGKDTLPEVEAEVARLQERIPFFHWALEFPDVYAQGGFDAIISNPPFQGGQKITGALGTDYRDYLVEALANSLRGSADLCAYFFLRAGRLVREGGGFGMLATNTIAQGDTREVGLEQLVQDRCVIIRSLPSQPWPGAAALDVSVVWLRRGAWRGEHVLDYKPVAGITPFLTVPGAASGKPYRLKVNEGKSFQGSIVLGMGFVLTPEEAHALSEKDPRNRDVLFPYLNGEDLNSRPDQSPSRWAINFFDWPLNRRGVGNWSNATEEEQVTWIRNGIVPPDYPGPVAADYPDCLAVLEERVMPERTRRKADGTYALRYPLYLRWWVYGEKRPLLYSTIKRMERVLVTAEVSKHINLVFQPTTSVFSHMLVVFPLDRWMDLSVLQSTIHEVWARDKGSTLETRFRYAPSDCLDTFPFPSERQDLHTAGETYYVFRQQLMLTRQEGLTKTYNRFHDLQESAEDIVRLRELHVEMDYAIADAYGWTDLDFGHGFHETKQGVRYTVSEVARREVLGWLLQLNHERYAEEVAQGLHEKGKGKGQRAKSRGQNAKGQEAQPNGEAALTSGRRDLFDTQLSLGEALE